MRVIGTGFGRTGTTSLEAALVQLGFGPCFSAADVFRQPKFIRPLLGAVEGGPVNWGELLAGYDSLVSEPAAVCWRELVEYFPEAKVVHTVRDPERWVESVERTLFRRRRHLASPYGRVAVRMSSMLGTDFAPLARLFQSTLEARALKSLAARRPERAVELFRAHTDQVTEAVPPDRLLTYDVGAGWEPLCEFLGVPVPDEPFPRVSTSAQYTSDGFGPFGASTASLFLRRTR
ncbi:sulfotransferase family protein [Actinomadura sp. 7K534]|uniref:sulfotransferase family protein n=1 Tax=Actinomadura sp. 7K534 TaxID=2530366 RepID=UPI0014048487|nr:sulfotransferase family protein [Actinomadura sp. 7K534]